MIEILDFDDVGFPVSENVACYIYQSIKQKMIDSTNEAYKKGIFSLMVLKIFER